MIKIGMLSGLLGLLVTTVAAEAATSDFAFEVAGPVTVIDDHKIATIRLVDRRSGMLVPSARVTERRTKIAHPKAPYPTYVEVHSLAPVGDGTYRYRLHDGAAERSIELSAIIPGEIWPVRGSVRLPH